MSKADNLKDFLTDVADAIRAKKGTTDLINPQNFSAEIASLSGGLEVIEMSETTATIEPNKVYVWGMVESLNITLGASTDASDFFAFRFRCSKPTMTVVTVNGATWADDTELDAQGKPILDLGSWYQCEIKGGTSALYARLAHYIPFADSNVEAVLLANGVGDGLGITYKDAAKVTSISTWFKGNVDITSFNELQYFTGIPKLYDYAFSDCSNLTSVILPKGVILQQWCFSGTGLITIENTETIKNTVLLTGTFKNCISLQSIYLPDTITSFEISCFEECSKLTQITFPRDLKLIGDYAFANCKSLIADVILLNVTSIGIYAFSSCESIRYVKFGSALKTIRQYSFSGCKNLKIVDGFENTVITNTSWNTFYGCSSLQSIQLPESLTTIGGSAFNGCSSLQSIQLPGSLTTIGNTAFNGCSSLQSIQLPGSLTTIGNSAFNGCSSLQSIQLPESLTTIGNSAFNGCTSLQSIIMKSTTPPTLSNTGAIPSTIRAIYVPDASVEVYKAATNWSSFASKIKGVSEMPA